MDFLFPDANFALPATVLLLLALLVVRLRSRSSAQAVWFDNLTRGPKPQQTPSQS